MGSFPETYNDPERYQNSIVVCVVKKMLGRHICLTRSRLLFVILK